MTNTYNKIILFTYYQLIVFRINNNLIAWGKSNKANEGLNNLELYRIFKKRKMYSWDNIVLTNWSVKFI